MSVCTRSICVTRWWIPIIGHAHLLTHSNDSLVHTSVYRRWCCTIDTHKRPLTVIWFCIGAATFSFQYEPPNHSNVCSFCPYTFVLVSLTFWYVLRGIMAERLNIMGFRIEENAMHLCVKSSAHDQPEWLPFGQVEARLDERMKADFKIVQGEYRKFFSLPTWFGWLVIGFLNNPFRIGYAAFGESPRRKYREGEGQGEWRFGSPTIELGR